MKVRNGFVSNSSSSNFIIAFDEIPTTMEECLEIGMTGNENMFNIFLNIIKGEISHGLNEDNKNYIRQLIWNEVVRCSADEWIYDNKFQESVDMVNQFIDENMGKYIVFTSFSDDTDDECLLRNGTAFQWRVPYLSFSTQ